MLSKPTVKEWIEYFKNTTISNERLKNDYGVDYKDINQKRNIILQLLNFHLNKFGNESIMIARVPGRINLMGRHVDHQGGNVNLVAIDKEIFITASLRSDFKIIAHNYDEEKFNFIKLDFANFISKSCKNWTDLINNKKFISKIRSPKGNWSNYLKAAYLRLINYFGLKKIFGVNCCIVGNILIAAGLSSSSALTMGMIHVLLHLNGLSLEDEDLIKLSAEAEWFVGTRGGSADQVAIKLAKKNKIANVRLFELEILDWVSFPQNCNLLVCNTNIIADKSGSKMDQFNQRVLAYEIGFSLIKKLFPQHAYRLKYLRDINEIGLNTKEIVEILLKLPEYLEYAEIPRLLGENWNEIQKKFSFKDISRPLPIRKVVAYGIAECMRSKSFIESIKSDNLQRAGRLMNISHYGDRVSSFDQNLKKTNYNNDITDDFLKELIDKNSNLEEIPGGYGCSIPEIDFIIDLANQHDGVYGAQLSGAGLGGCCMILAEQLKSSDLKKQITKKYIWEFGKPCTIKIYKPVKGISLFYKI
ncbi:MAG: hypothetical protein EU539_12105 [Promethearchaeota archaeon]|nr:MAG: hypothetical protein EU539_12105 [Candidatus Lokiarchaeota archaeon]